MKRTFFMIVALVGIMTVSGFAQSKPAKFKFLKVSRDTKKEAKRLEKDGWKVFPGNPPIAQQLNSGYSKQAETDTDGFPKWIIANGSSVAQTQAAAEMQSIELAKNNLVGLIETNMRSVVESDVSNNQLDAKDAATITKTIQVSANKVSKKLGMVQPMFKVYRAIKKNTEVQVMIGYNYELVRKQILEEMKAELQLETDDVRKRYEKFLNPEKYNSGEIKNISEDVK
jgi:hypothetical protein